jgi:hypothetical protein
MIKFNFIGNPYPSLQEMQRAETNFIEKLGPFKEEFENRGGVVTFNYSIPENDEKRITFNLTSGELSDFIRRWNEYNKKVRGDEESSAQ